MESKKNQLKYTELQKEEKESLVEEPYIAWDLTKASAKISSGLATGILSIIQDRLGISNKDLSELLLISPRTLDRRKKEAILPADESERSFRIARLTDLASEIFGSMEKASVWFKEPNFALGNKTPIELVKTEPGARLVERTLHQIGHGITV
ncbi:MAG: DUF2384 domain-containing protein [Balneolaceae bacterium]|nr:DUF2384 domain-containing protein [Balneolaceae bacterium]